MSLRLLTLAALAATSLSSHAAISITDPTSTYTQTFNSLTTNTLSSTTWTNDSTLAGWSLFTYKNDAIVSYIGGTGSSNAGSFYSFGLGGDSDRALGGLGSAGGSGNYFGSPQPAGGSVAGYIAVAFTNGTSSTLDSFSLGFDGEQWRYGGNTTPQSMVLQYGFGSSFTDVTTWTTPGAAFNWTSPVTSTPSTTLTGNGAGLVSNLGGTISGLQWQTGETLWVRWIENNDAGNDHGLAIDNFSLSVTAVTAPVPEPSTYAMLLAGLGAVGVVARRRRQNP